MVKTCLKGLVLLTLLLILGFIVLRHIKTYKLEYVADKRSFAQSFDPGGKVPVNLNSDCDFFALNCEGHEHYDSPYVPYLPLNAELVDQNLEHWRTLLGDPLWGVFWVGVDDATHMRVNYFGPYRF